MTKFTKMTAAAAVTLLSGAMALNCTPKHPDNSNEATGMVSLALTLPGGISISSVHYKIHSNQPTTPPADKDGDINTSNPQAQPSVETSYPASTNDVVTLTATTSAGEPCSGSSTTPPGFTVVSNGQAVVNLVLTCGLLQADGGPGSVRVNATVVDNSDICPVLNSWEVSPLQTGPTGVINVSSGATDGDAADMLTYKWTASPAPATDPFTNSNVATTAFNCPGVGNFDLTITINDHHMPVSCPTTRTISVSCGQCGNGTIDSGETCDSAAAFMNNTCNPTTCQSIPVVCGNGLLQPGEQCDSAAAIANNTCGSATSATPCQNIAIACGNGLVQPGEQCEPPNTATCTATCQTISACLVCETTGTACLGTKVTTTSAFGCAGLTGAALTNCNALHSCLDTHPTCSTNGGATSTTDPTACFCGALSAAACAGAPSASIAGQCAAAYFAVYGGVSDPNRDSILGDFFNRTLPVGMANNLYACDVTKTCFPVCM
jgi:hypothetical protein